LFISVAIGVPYKSDLGKTVHGTLEIAVVTTLGEKCLLVGKFFPPLVVGGKIVLLLES
jgi:hypothetical protein